MNYVRDSLGFVLFCIWVVVGGSGAIIMKGVSTSIDSTGGWANSFSFFTAILGTRVEGGSGGAWCSQEDAEISLVYSASHVVRGGAFVWVGGIGVVAAVIDTNFSAGCALATRSVLIFDSYPCRPLHATEKQVTSGASSMTAAESALHFSSAEPPPIAATCDSNMLGAEASPR